MFEELNAMARATACFNFFHIYSENLIQFKNMSNQMSPQVLISAPSKNIFYIDRLKIVLTILVILHHAFITYGPSGGWYFTQKTTKIGALVPMTMVVAINQAFFMGFFFFLSAYFIKPSYERKGTMRFVTDRLKRLGIPLIFYSFVLSPVLSYLVYYFNYKHISFIKYLGVFHGWIDFGVLWFVAALLLFTFVYVLLKALIKNYVQKAIQLPSIRIILTFAVCLGLISFFVRIVFPVGWVLKPFGFQLGHFSQYIALFTLGLIAFKNNWPDALSYQMGKKLAIVAIILVLLFPVFYILKIKLNTPIEWYSGGLHWQAFMYAVWEQLTGISIIVALLSIGKNLWNKPSSLISKLSGNTFAVYIFHPLVLISLSLSVRNWAVDPAIKLLVVAPLAVICSFLLAAAIKTIPGVKKVI